MHFLLEYELAPDDLARRPTFRQAHLALAWAAADPYVLNGLVTRWRVRPWATVVGPLAATPIRP